MALLAACGGEGGEKRTLDEPDAEYEPERPIDVAAPISERRPINSTCIAPPPPPPSGRVKWELAFADALPDGSRLRRVVQLVQSPAHAERWYLARQDGHVLTFREGAADATKTVLDLGDALDTSSPEHGLVGLALAPDFGESDHVFVVYTAPASGEGMFWSRLSRFTRSEDGTFDRDSERVVLQIKQRTFTHSGNHVAFGPDGYLYFSVGDDRRTDVHAQNPSTLHGVLLRIDVQDLDEEDPPYDIPPDNPFVDGGGAPEVYAYGFRNPWRFSFEEDGTLYLGDVGQDSREEINVVEKGGNYGWPLREGTLCFREDPCDGDFIDPLVEYTHAAGASVTAGFVYRGEAIPALRGHYVYADYKEGNVWSIPTDMDQPPARLEIEAGPSIVSFARARDGELYGVRYEAENDKGGIYRLVANEPEPSDFPERLSETGCMSPEDPREPGDELIPYAPIARLWSDDAGKERYLAVPHDRSIGVRKDGVLEFPSGTVLVKHFKFEDYYHETRLLMRHRKRWAGYTYAWDSTQTDAVLLETSRTVTLPNGVRWRYPSRANCTRCHTESAGFVLGLDVRQLDHARVYEREEDINQLRWLLEHDFFEPDIDSLDALRGDRTSFVDPFGDAALDERARSYLHANCAGCHRPGSNGRGTIDLRYEVPFADTKTCDAKPREGKVWELGNWDEQLILRPGRPDDSTLFIRMEQRSMFQMPPLATRDPHKRGLTLIREWIETMSACE